MVAGASNDTLLARFNSVRLYGALLDAGVELYEYNRTMMHHKIMTIDGLWSTVGTANFDNRSFSHNEESNVSVLRRRRHARADRILRARHRGVGTRHARMPGNTAACRTDRRGARVVRAGSGVGHSRRRPHRHQLEDLAEEVPEPLVDLAVEGPLLGPGRRVEALRRLACRFRSPGSAVRPVPGRRRQSASSSFNSNERLPKLAEPMMLKIPSTTIALVCIIVGWYSKTS